ncbi:MAG: Rossmann-like and DUF2520 domain-containing protein [Arcticibacter sp.]
MKIVLLGSGNVATHLGPALQQGGHEILQVWSLTLSNAAKLGRVLSADFTDDLGTLDHSADIYIISVKDDVIGEVASSFPFPDKLLVHTSGTVGMDLLGKDRLYAGVFYPLQTFSKQKPINFQEVPVLIEGSTEEVNTNLNVLAASISKTVRAADSAQRASIHLAAVFACNFSNHLYTVSKGLLEKRGLDFNLLLPLIAETAAKVQSLDPADAQTGPAARNDQETISRHKEQLKASPDLLQLYSLMTESIIRCKHPDQ